MNNLFWRLPADKVQMAEVVRAVACRGVSWWSKTIIELRAPQEMTTGENPRAVYGVGWASAGDSFEPRMAGSSMDPLKHRSHIADVITGKLPGFCSFELTTPDQQAIEIVARLVTLGYNGWLDFSWAGGSEAQRTTKPLWVKCNIRFNEWNGRGDEPGQQPARVRITWHDAVGYERYAQQKIEVLNSLNLEQYDNTAVTA